MSAKIENKQAEHVYDETEVEQESDHQKDESIRKQDDIESAAAEKSGIHKDTIKTAFNAAWDSICDALENGYDVKLHGKGRFYLSKRSARVGRNPLTGEEYDVPEREAMAFQTSPAYAKRLRERRKAMVQHVQEDSETK